MYLYTITILASILVYSEARIGELWDNSCVFENTTEDDISAKQLLLNAGFFEGDIIITDYDEIASRYSPDIAKYYSLKLLLNPPQQEQEQRQFDIFLSSRWYDRDTSGKVLIPYRFNDGGFTTSMVNMIRGAMDTLETSGVVRFVPWVQGDIDYLWIYGRPDIGGCYSNVGRKGGWQTLHLQTNACLWPMGIQHELMHALGFWHEQSRADRDDYIKVNYENIISSKSGNYYKQTLDRADPLGFPYEYGSIMHYRSWAFSSNRQPTMIAIYPNGTVRKDIDLYNWVSTATLIDIEQIRALYMCPAYPRYFEDMQSVADYCNNDCPCWEGRGDCDSDAQCQGDLVCQYGNNDDEVCVKPSERCSMTKPCPEGLEGCTTDNDCIGDSVCNNNKCAAAPTPAPTLRPHRGWKKRRSAALRQPTVAVRKIV